MKWLLDTNIVSEFSRPKPDEKVVAWVQGVADDEIRLSVISLAELGRGIALLPDGKRKAELSAWLTNDLLVWLADRVYPIDTRISTCWGDLLASMQKKGVQMNPMDGFIAATAMVHGCTLATRNTKDFVSVPVAVHNPWINEQS